MILEDIVSSLCDILHISKGITSLIGSGGKSTLLTKLAYELSVHSKVIVAATTKMLPMSDTPIYTGNDMKKLTEIMKETDLLTVGTYASQGKLGAPAIDVTVLKNAACYIILECDGSRTLPLKAHRIFEPVVPESSTQTIMLLGLSGIGKKISETVHCPALYAKLTGCSESDTVTPEIAAKALVEEYRSDARLHYDKVILNQIESEKDLSSAIKIAGIINNELPVSVFCGNIREGELQCLY